MQTAQQRHDALPPYPIEVTFPDIRKWKNGNCGVDYVHSFDSGVDGPHVMLMALVHGNEVSGAIVVDTLLQAGFRPKKGRVSLGFANVEAYYRFDKEHPDATRFVDEDMNRVWGTDKLEGNADSLELRRARALRPIVDTVDFLLDIHSMHEEGPPLMMSGPLEKGKRFAANIGVPENIVVDAGHANGKRLRDYAGFGDAGSPKNALLIETGQHFSAHSRNVALDAACRFLIFTGVASAADLAVHLTQTVPAQQRVLQVTQPIVADSVNFEFTQDSRGLKVIDKAGTVIARDGDREITTPYDRCVIVQASLRHTGPGVTVARLAKILQD